jgi:hypothetical protein
MYRGDAIEMEEYLIEQIKPLANIQIGNKHIKETRIKNRDGKGAGRVGQYDKKGNLLRVFDFQIEVTRELGYDQGAISRCLNGKIPHYKGYVWAYVDVDKVDSNGQYRIF